MIDVPFPRAAIAQVSSREPLEIWYGRIDPPVVAQRDITIREKTSIHPLDPEPLPLECSGLVSLNGRLALTSDRHSHVIFTLPIDLSQPVISIGLPESTQIVDTERRLIDDAECLTARTGPDGLLEAILFCSLSNDPAGERRFKRQHIARLVFDEEGRVLPERVTVLSGDRIRDALARQFSALGVQEYESFNAGQQANTPRWGNIEGIAWTPLGDTLLCGMRNPIAGGDALFFALAGVQEAFDAQDPARIRVVDLFRLDLGGRGVSDLAWDPISRGYLLTAALSNGPRTDDNQVYPLENLDTTLFWWSGDKRESPVLVARFPDLNMEAVTRIEETDFLALGSDEGDVSEGRRGRQSVITIMHFVSPPSRSGSSE